MAVTVRDLQEAHNKGQEDGFGNHYDPPIHWFKLYFGDDEHLLQEAYDNGFAQGKSQR